MAIEKTNPTRPLFYRKPEPLDVARHNTLGVRADSDFSFCQTANVVMLTAMEFALASRSYPIVFAANTDSLPVAILASLARGRKPDELDRRLKRGTVLVREFRGERHTVTVAPGGFVWRGTAYPSLSTIARAITGTAWNGPRFFGLRSNARADRGAPPKQSAAKPTSPTQPHSLLRGRDKTSRRAVQR